MSLAITPEGREVALNSTFSSLFIGMSLAIPTSSAMKKAVTISLSVPFSSG